MLFLLSTAAAGGASAPEAGRGQERRAGLITEDALRSAVLRADTAPAPSSPGSRKWLSQLGRSGPVALQPQGATQLPAKEPLLRHAAHACFIALGRQMRFHIAEEGHEGPEKESKGWRFFWQVFLDYLIFVSVWLFLTILFAFYWDQTKEYLVDPPDDGQSHLPQDLDGAWKFRFFDCSGDPCMCCFAMCCPSVRWADTMRMSGFIAFWCGVACFLLCQIVSGFFMAPVGLIPLVMMGTYYRQKLRKMFDMPHSTCSTVMQDCLAYCFCSCFAINQEARTLEEAYVVRHPAVEDAREELMVKSYRSLHREGTSGNV